MVVGLVLGSPSFNHKERIADPGLKLLVVGDLTRPCQMAGRISRTQDSPRIGWIQLPDQNLVRACQFGHGRLELHRARIFRRKFYIKNS
jgi:hypothetical protein